MVAKLEAAAPESDSRAPQSVRDCSLSGILKDRPQYGSSIPGLGGVAKPLDHHHNRDGNDTTGRTATGEASARHRSRTRRTCAESERQSTAGARLGLCGIVR